jgi:hypothetical protein
LGCAITLPQERFEQLSGRGNIEDCDRAVKLDGKNAAAHHNRGIALAKLGDEKGAQAAVEECIKIVIEEMKFKSDSAQLAARFSIGFAGVPFFGTGPKEKQ